MKVFEKTQLEKINNKHIMKWQKWQFQTWQMKAVFLWFLVRLSWIGTVVVVVAKENHDLMLNIVQKLNHTKVKVVHGGTSRHRSIFNGLQAFSSSADSLTPKPKVVIIHDAVRPFVEEDLLLKITLAAKEQGVCFLFLIQILFQNSAFVWHLIRKYMFISAQEYHICYNIKAPKLR